MKQCRRCGVSKTHSEFNRRSASADGLDPYCRPCKRAVDRAHYQASPARRRAIVASNRQARARNREHVWAYLLEHPCVDCGEADPIVLQFDHRDPSMKVAGVADMMRLSLATIQKEIAKCDVRCANCHARRTAQQFGWYASVG